MNGYGKNNGRVMYPRDKLQPDQFPAELRGVGMQVLSVQRTEEGYSGVAILTKQEPDHVEYGMGIERCTTTRAVLSVRISGICLSSAFIILPELAGTNDRISRWYGWKISRNM